MPKMSAVKKIVNKMMGEIQANTQKEEVKKTTLRKTNKKLIENHLT